MFAVDHVLVSDAVLDAPFACHLGSCLGACCVQGERGAPLEPGERSILEDALPIVRGRLRPEAIETIAREGVWKEERPGEFAVSAVDGRECVFVRYDGPIAKCTLQEAHNAGRLAFEKPISCHLYPIRVERHGDGEHAVEVLNYERIDICRPAIRHGRNTATPLSDFLRKPLTRKYGPAWYRRFQEAVNERHDLLHDAPC